nr:hypothetical protein [Micromonospora narathiwatensis]
MRPGPPLLIGAVAFAGLHAAGVLVAQPVWRYAEVLSLGLLLAYALVSGVPAPRWAVPAALTVLLLDAVRTTPPAPGTERHVLMIERGADLDVPSGFESGLTLCWASLTAVAVLLTVWRRDGWHRRVTAGAAVAALLVAGYAVVRVVDIWLAVRAEPRPYLHGTDSADPVIAVGLAVLPPLALGLTALALATALAGHGRRLASAGAVLLAVVALPYLDASIGAVPLPLYAADRTAMFAGNAITPTLSLPRPVPALTVAVELAAYLLLVVGLTGSRRPTRAVTTEPAG